MIENTPDHCPGPTSESAGKSDACAGCPSRNLCSSGAVKDLAAKQAEDVRLIAERLTSVKNKILILSGKGGVGKSTFTASVARALAAKNPECNVAILDVDLCGPSQPRILGVSGESIHRSGSGWSPVYVEDNLSVVSIGFLLSSPDDAIVWRGPKKSGMIRQFLTEVDWGDVDYLLIDFPPGTSDEHLSATSLITSADAIIVTTPQEIALLDVRKEIDFCHKTGVNILGVIDNMCEFVCAKCGTQSEIFPQTTGGTEKMCKDLGVPLLGRVPLDPKIARSADEGSDFLLLATTSVAAKALIGIAEKIVSHFEMKLSSAIITNK